MAMILSPLQSFVILLPPELISLSIIPLFNLFLLGFKFNLVPYQLDIELTLNTRRGTDGCKILVQIIHQQNFLFKIDMVCFVALTELQNIESQRIPILSGWFLIKYKTWVFTQLLLLGIFHKSITHQLCSSQFGCYRDSLKYRSYHQIILYF